MVYYISHLCSESPIQEKRTKLDGPQLLVEVQKMLGGKAPRKQLAVPSFHKRVRETSGNSNSDSGERIKTQSAYLQTYFSSVFRKTN